MPSFDGGLFSLGYGNPNSPSEDPNTSETQRLVAELELKILDGLMEQIKSPAGLLSGIDSQIFQGLNDTAQPIVDNINSVDNKIRNDVGSKVEILSAKVGPLNRLAQKVGINLTKAANDEVSVKQSKATGDILEGIKNLFSGITSREPEEQAGVDIQPGQSAKLSEVVGNRAQSPTRSTTRPAPRPTIPAYIIPALTEAGIKPADVNKFHIWPDGNVHIQHSGGVQELENPGDWPERIDDPLPPLREDPAELGDKPIPIPGLHDIPQEIEGEQELPLTNGIDTWPGGDIVGELPTGECPDPEIICGSCECGPCICEQPPVVQTTLDDTRYEIPPGPSTTISEQVTPVVNVLNNIQLPIPEPAPEDKQYIGYCNTETGQVVVLQYPTRPTGPNLKAVAAGDHPNEVLVRAQEACVGKPPTGPEAIPKFAPPDLIGLCEDLSYAHGRTTQHMFDAIMRKSPLGALFGYEGSVADNPVSNFFSKSISFNPLMIPVTMLGRAAIFLVSLIDKSYAKMLESYLMAGVDFSDSMTARLLIGVLESWVSSDFSKFKQPFVYKNDSIVPSLFPDADQATNALIVGAIDKPTWKLWVQMNNYCAEPYEKNIEVNRSKFSPLVLLDMLRRDQIDRNDFAKELRANGFMGTYDASKFEAVNEFVPPIQDLVRFMVRDVFDPAVVNSLRLDDEFDNKWVNEAEQWGKWQGVPDDVAKMYWRAHWQIPSSGQLFDIYHRNKEEPNQVEGKFDLPRLTRTLQINDNLPSMIPYLEQISEHLLTRVDIRRAYRLGSIVDSDVRKNYIMRGYSDANADIMVKYADNDKEQFLMGRREVKLYRDGIISDAEFIQSMQKYDPKPQMFDYIYRITEAERRAPIIKRCLKSLEKQYLDRALDDEQLQVKLDELDVPVVTQQRFKDELECLQRSEYKELTANQLCQIYSGGQIAGHVFIDRLEKLGYEFPEAMEIKMLCDWKIDAKEARINEKALAAAEKERQKLAKEAAKEVIKKGRDENHTAKMRQKRKQAKDRRELRLLKVVKKLSECNETDLEIAGALVREGMSTLVALYPFTIEERVSIMERTVERCKPKTAEEFNDQWLRLAEEFGRIQGPLT